MLRTALLLALATVSAAAFAADRVTGHEFATRSEVIAPHAMAATSQPLATQIALDVMKDGGSAVDAAIAANAALGLMEPTGNGIGGDLFAIVWDPKTHKLHAYNGSGRSPRSLTLAEFQRRGLKEIPATGPLPVSVPGAVDGWFALHARFGRKPMAENLVPAIAYAREGHPVAEVIAYYWDRSVPKLVQYPGFREQFTIDGHAPRKGQMWRNP
ncbi:MAG: gamma-glutamyltransferase, partial [Stenotrophomonas sp.]